MIKSKKISILYNKGVEIIEINKIIYFKSDRNYTILITTNKKEFIVSKPIKFYEDLLKNDSFFRVHKSYIVNFNHIQRYGNKNNNKILLFKDYHIPLSRRIKSLFVKKFEDYINGI